MLMERDFGPSSLLAESFRLSGTPACITDPAANHVFVNSAYCRLVGFTADELLGHPFTLLLPEELRAQGLKLYSSGIHDGEQANVPAESILIRKDGRSIVVSFTSRLLTDTSGERFVVSVLSEITHYKAAERALRKTVLELEAIMANAPVAIAFTRCRRIVRFNQRFAEMFCLPADEVKNPPAASFHPSQQAYDTFALQALPVLGAGRSFQAEMPLRRHDDSIFWAQVIAYAINPADPLQGTIWIVEDRSSTKEAEQALVHARDELELHVEARTAELASANARLQAEIAERRLAEQRVRHMAQHDALTGLPNRNLLKERLTQALALARRNVRNVAIMFLDLDRFKTINDSLGHIVGDSLLKEVAQRIRRSIRATDTVSRLGGDEFVVVLPDLANPSESVLVAEKLIDALAPAFSIDDHELHVTPSIGICVYPRDGEDCETLMRNADTAMYQAKAGGRNGFRFFTPQMNLLAAQHFQVESSLRRAISQDELRLHFQPIVSLPDQRIRGLEVLLRWQHPKLGLLPPGEFIGIAEETGLIVPTGEWVIRQACLQNQWWQEQGLPIVPLSVNLSARQFRQPGLVDMIRQTLEQTGQTPALLELEITETTLMQQSPQTLQTLEELGNMGISLSIDDFGTGYSSLSYLKRLPVHKLKIDRSFIMDLTTSSDDLAIVSAVLALARTLQLGVVAEGVETPEQLGILSELGCGYAQGYYFSSPQPAMESERLFGLETIR